MKDWDTDDAALVVLDWKQFLAMKMPPRDVLLTPWLESSSLAMVYARPGVGKTHFALGIAHALATGTSFLRWAAPAPVPVLFVDGEMAGTLMQKRMDDIVAATGAEPADGMFRLVSRDVQRFNDMPNLGGERGQLVISEHMGDARVVILDNIGSLIHGAKENEAEGWEPVAQWAMRERSQGRTLIFVHHAGKSGGQRGTSKREDLMDIIIRLERPEGERDKDDARFMVRFDKARSLVGKQIASFEARLTQGGDGVSRWSAADSGDDGRLAEMHSQGMTLAQIGEVLGCDKSTVKRRLDRLKDAA